MGRVMRGRQAGRQEVAGRLEAWFGKWEGILASVFASLVVGAGLLTAAACCVIPCGKGLLRRLIETALLKQMTGEPPPYSHNLMILHAMESKEGEQEQEIYQITPQRKVWQKSTIYKEEKGGIVGIKTLLLQSYVV